MDIHNVEEEYGKFRKKHYLWPALLIASGTLLLFENFGLLPEFSLGRIWPVLLIVWGLDILWVRGQKGSPR